MLHSYNHGQKCWKGCFFLPLFSSSPAPWFNVDDSVISACKLPIPPLPHSRSLSSDAKESGDETDLQDSTFVSWPGLKGEPFFLLLLLFVQ